jgi:hypothetical protein
MECNSFSRNYRSLMKLESINEVLSSEQHKTFIRGVIKEYDGVNRRG